MPPKSASKISRTTARRRFNEVVRTLEVLVQDEEKSIRVINGQMTALDTAYNYLVEMNDALLGEIDETTEKDDFDKALLYADEISHALTKIQISTSRHVESLSPTPVPASTTVSPSQVNSGTTPKQNIKCKQIEVHPFSGNIREYVPWKKTFQEDFQPYYGDKAGIVLRDSVCEDGKRLLRSIETKNINAMWTALDTKYGNEQKLVEAVIGDIESLPVCHDGDLHSLRTLLESIEQARADLKFVKLESEIEHSSTVKMIERRLPPQLKTEWAKFKRNKNVTSISKMFPIIMEFLTESVACAEDVETMGGQPTQSHPVLCTQTYSAQPAFSQPATAPCNHSSKISSPMPCQNFDDCIISSEDPLYDSSNIDPPIESNDCHLVADQRPPQNTSSKPVPDNNDKKVGSNSRFCTYHKNNGGHFPRFCNTLRRMSTADQVKWFQNDGKNCCRLCLAEGHGTNGKACPITSFKECGKNGCTKKHFHGYHDALEVVRNAENKGSANATVYAVSVNTSNLESSTVPASYRTSVSPALTAQLFQSKNVSASIGVLIDTGSVITLIHKRLVRQFNLRKASNERYHVTMETVGGDVREYDAYAYRIQLKSRDGSKTHVTALAVDSIGSIFPQVDMTEACNEFGISTDSVNYPSNRSLDLLVGMDNAHLSLQILQTKNGLVLAENAISSIIYGSHSSFARNSNPRHYRATCYGIKMSPVVSDLFATDILGVECSPKCGSCRCGKCAPGSGTLSLKQEREWQLIKDRLSLNRQLKAVTGGYPWIKPPSELPDNYDLAYRRLVQTENKLAKDPVAAASYQGDIDDMKQRTVARLLTKEEDAEWRSNPSNPVQFLPHSSVPKPSSTSTPSRFVLDPTAEYLGHCVNNYWGTGPNLIANALGLQIRFREFIVAILADIAKFYHTVHTTPMEWHCHRFLWRDMERDREPDIYIIVRNSFGSRPAGTVAIAALFLVADTGEIEFPIGAKTIRNQTFVDDILDSTESKEQAAEIIRQTDACLDIGSFKTKGWTIVDARDVTNSPCCQNEDTSLQIGGSEETVLGIHWDKSTDSFFFKAKLNFSKRKKKIRTGPDLKVDEIFSLPGTLHLRAILSQVNGFYDPMGLTGPYLVELKFSLGKLLKVMKAECNDVPVHIWDLPIPLEYDELWRKLLNVAFHIQDIRFPRHLKPENAVGNPWLIMCCDSSMMAFATCGYVRWTLKDGTFWCRLIASKSRIWPLEPDDFLSVCRGELQGAVLAKRLGQTIITESRFKFEKVLYLTDSDIVRAQIAKDGHAFDTFVGNRVGEIRSKTSPDQWYHIHGDENVSADLLSRGSINPEEMGPDSYWQRGPPMLYTPFSEWQISEKYHSDKPLPELRDLSVNQRTMAMMPTEEHQQNQSYPSNDDYGDCTWGDILPILLPDSDVTTVYSTRSSNLRVVNTIFSPEIEENIAKRFKILNFSKLQNLLAVTYRFFHALAWKKGDGHFVKYMSRLETVNADQLELALQFWIRQAQQILAKKIKIGKFRRLKPSQDSKTRIFRLNGRFGNHPQGYHPIMLPSNHPFVKLLVVSVHRRSHGGATSTAAKVKDEYHVLKIRNLAKLVRSDCTLCRRIEKRLLQAPMGVLPIERFRPSYPFEHCSCDIFGPYKLQVPGRVTRGRPMDFYGQGYGLLITCLSTRSLHIEAMEGQDTSAFLMSFRRFISIRGHPRFMYSDNGGQIVAADDELKQIVAGWDDKQLQEFGAENSIRWQYSSPGSPWQNGVSEALVKSVKRSLAVMWQTKPRIPIMQLQTIFYEIAALLNERPINLGHSEVPGDWDSDCNTYLCPNQLLLGRSTVRIPSGPFSITATSHTELFHNVQSIVTEWWKRWTSLFLPTLLPQSKWHSKDRTVSVGDIVHVRDLNLVRGNWQIAEVIKADPSTSDSIVREVEVRYKKLPDNPLIPLNKYTGVPDKTERRDVKNLVILVTNEERKCAQ